MKAKEDCVEHVTGCSCGHVRVEDMSTKEFHDFLFFVRKNIEEQRRLTKNPSKTTT